MSHYQQGYPTAGSPTTVTGITIPTNPYVDQFGTAYPSAPVQYDWRDTEITRLRMDMVNKETSLREAYMEIGRLHEQLRGLTAFDKWSNEKSALTPPVQP